MIMKFLIVNTFVLIFSSCSLQEPEINQLDKVERDSLDSNEEEEIIPSDNDDVSEHNEPEDSPEDNQISEHDEPEETPDNIIDFPAPNDSNKDLVTDTFTPIEVLDRESIPWKISYSVGRFHKRTAIDNSSMMNIQNCTFTLVSPHHIIGNSHCLDHTDDASNSFIELGYQESIPQDEREIYYCEHVVARSKYLDVLLLECEGRPGDKWGWVELAQTDAPIGEKTYTIHHPKAGYKKYTRGVNHGNKMDGFVWSNKHIWTNSATIAKGSSGSLTFSENTHKAIMVNFAGGGGIGTRSMGSKSASVLDFFDELLGRDFLYQQSQGEKFRLAQVASL